MTIEHCVCECVVTESRHTSPMEGFLWSRFPPPPPLLSPLQYPLTFHGEGMDILWTELHNTIILTVSIRVTEKEILINILNKFWTHLDVDVLYKN